MENALGIFTGITIAILSFRVFFDSKQDFFKCLEYCFTPNMISWIRGEYGKDFWCELKTVMWIFFSFLCGYGARALIVMFTDLR